jgi:hypothetical protein
MREWFALTFLMGSFFVGGQIYEYANLVRENRNTFRALRDRATSYWNVYYRRLYPEKRDYPGLKALHQMEMWAAETGDTHQFPGAQSNTAI